MTGQVRTARPSIVLNGADYYDKLSPYFVTMEYTDTCDGEKADDLSIDLADRDKRFISDWMPDKGAFLDIAIVTERWFALNAPALSLDCGRLYIDTIDFAMPDNTMSLKASSIPTTAHIKGSDETRGWENTSFKDICQQIAGENKMTLDYQSDVNPKYKRIEQTEESGLAFIKTQARAIKLSLKVHRDSLVIFDEEKYEAKPAKFTLAYGSTAIAGGLPTYEILGGNFTTKLTDTAKKARLKHNNLETGRLTEEEADSGEDDDDGSQININEDPIYGPDSAAGGDPFMLTHRSTTSAEDDAGIADWTEDSPEFNFGKGAGGADAGQRRAKAALRAANKHKWTGSIDLKIGNPLIAAGMTFNLVGCGKYDGKWFVVSAKHKVGPMYTTSLEVRRCLIGY